MNLVLHSERLILTPYDHSDLDLAIEMFTDPDVRKYAGGVMEEDEIRGQISNWVRRGSDGYIGIWSISNRVSGEKLGSAALLPIPIDENETDFSLVIPGKMPDGDIEIGYFLKKSAWGKGYATEACECLLGFVFEETPLLEVVATFEESNVASRHVLTKTGFVDRGMRRCYGVDGPDYRITRDNWIQKQRSATS